METKSWIYVIVMDLCYVIVDRYSVYLTDTPRGGEHSVCQEGEGKDFFKRQ